MSRLRRAASTIISRIERYAARSILIVWSLFGYRKQLVSTILIIVAIALAVLIGTRNAVVQVYFFLASLLLSTDYSVLKLISEQLYLGIQDQDDDNPVSDPLKSAMEQSHINYYTKRYSELGNQKQDVIRVSNGIVDVRIGDSRYMDNLTEGMRFEIYFDDPIEYDDQTHHHGQYLATAEVEAVSVPDRAIQLVVIDWNNEYPVKRLKFQSGRPEEIGAYVSVEITDEVENSDINELQKLYETIRNVYQNRTEIIK